MNRFAAKKSFSKLMVYDFDTNQELTHRLWCDPNVVVDQGTKLIQKACVRTTVKLESDVQNFVIKRHVERSWRHFAKQWVSRSRAEKCWNDSWFLYDNGYPTPKPVAYLENRFGVFRGNSFYVYEYVEGETLKEKATGSRNQRLIRQYIKQLAHIWSLHAKLNIELSDGHPANFLIDPAGKMWVIDLDKLRKNNATTNSLNRLEQTLEQTLLGVFWEPTLIEYGKRKFREAIQQPARVAA